MAPPLSMTALTSTMPPHDSGIDSVDHTRLRLLLVDDHAIVREGMRAILEEESDLAVVGECSTGDEALQACVSAQPDVVLLDLNMPGLDPVSTIRGLAQRVPGVRIMVFTSFGEDDIVRATLDAGAIGFLLKDARRDELLQAIRSVAAGQPWLAPTAQRQLMELLRRPPDPLQSLTERESDVLGLIGRGCSNKLIARELGLSEGTVKGYVSQILAKLGVADRTQAALIAARTPRR
jgi:DNA-binding NarL/FixJ family response regulator